MFCAVGANRTIQLELLAQYRSMYRVNQPGKFPLHSLDKPWTYPLSWSAAVRRNQRKSPERDHVQLFRGARHAGLAFGDGDDVTNGQRFAEAFSDQLTFDSSQGPNVIPHAK